jgi:hypothetical protein
MTSIVVRLDTAELNEIRATDRPVVDGVIYIYLREQDGIRTYRGSDRSTLMGIVEEDGVTYRMIMQVRAADRWVFDARDEGRASRHVGTLTRRALDTHAAAKAEPAA